MRPESSADQNERTSARVENSPPSPAPRSGMWSWFVRNPSAAR